MLATLLLLLPLTLAQKPVKKDGNSLSRQHAPEQPQALARGFQLDERLMPITATTTVVVQMTVTDTIWVQPTGQVAFGASASSSISSVTSAVSSSLPSASALAEAGDVLPGAEAAQSSSIASSSGLLATASELESSRSASITASSSSTPSIASTSSTISSSAFFASSVFSSSSASFTPSSASPSSSAGTLSGPLMNGYYPDWSGWYLAPESVDFSKFDVIDFAFALPTADYGLEFTQDDSSDLLTRLVTLAHAAGKWVKLSIGGWTGSTYFSTICASSSARKTFISNIVAAYDSYDLDGIDIDWEYPGTQGASGNAVSSSDAANFLLFLTELRAALPDGALISLATQVWPFTGSNGSPMTDVSGFAAVIDWILIMNYDVWGSSDTPGPNAPLSDGCGNSTQPLANAYAAVASWTAAGLPANQITLGVPAYGYLQMSSASQLVTRRGLPVPPHRRKSEMEERASYVAVYNDNYGTTDGQVMFESLISQGALALDSSGAYVGAGGFTRHWDSCSSTPWLKSSSSGQLITYDDPTSMSLKAQFAVQAGLRGCNIFSMDGDWTGSSWPLTDSVRSGMGL